MLTPRRLGGAGAESCESGTPWAALSTTLPPMTLLRRGRDSAGHRPRRRKHGEVLPRSPEEPSWPRYTGLQSARQKAQPSYFSFGRGPGAYLYFLPVWDDYMQIAAAKPGAPWARLSSSLACFGHRRSLRSSRPRWNINAILRPSDTVTQQSIARA